MNWPYTLCLTLSQMNGPLKIKFLVTLLATFVLFTQFQRASFKMSILLLLSGCIESALYELNSYKLQ